jgi:serine/threonine protein kinase
MCCLKSWLQLTDFGLSRVGLINSTDDLTGPAAKVAMQIDDSFLPADNTLQRERRQQQAAVGTPDYLAPEILLGTGHGKIGVPLGLLDRRDVVNVGASLYMTFVVKIHRIHFVSRYASFLSEVCLDFNRCDGRLVVYWSNTV